MTKPVKGKEIEMKTISPNVPETNHLEDTFDIGTSRYSLSRMVRALSFRIRACISRVFEQCFSRTEPKNTNRNTVFRTPSTEYKNKQTINPISTSIYEPTPCIREEVSRKGYAISEGPQEGTNFLAAYTERNSSELRVVVISNATAQRIREKEKEIRVGEKIFLEDKKTNVFFYEDGKFRIGTGSSET